VKGPRCGVHRCAAVASGLFRVVVGGGAVRRSWVEALCRQHVEYYRLKGWVRPITPKLGAETLQVRTRTAGMGRLYDKRGTRPR
jgi:hypothetical protein